MSDQGGTPQEHQEPYGTYPYGQYPHAGYGTEPTRPYPGAPYSGAPYPWAAAPQVRQGSRVRRNSCRSALPTSDRVGADALPA